MKRLPLLVLLISLCLPLWLGAEKPSVVTDGSKENLIDRPHAQDWISDIDQGWLTQEGDDSAWSNPGFDDSHWQPARLDDLGSAPPGWRWFRRHLSLHENHPELSLLILGGFGSFSLFLFGFFVLGLVFLSC